MIIAPRSLGVTDIVPLALGSTVLGTGGGGDPYIGRLMAQQAIRECGPVTLVDPDDVPADAFVFLVGMMGAPAIMVEKLPSGKEVLEVIDVLSKNLGRKITHIGCLEAGGINAMIPIAAAARTGLPLIDADGMGRAFPELQMLLPSLDGINATPLALIDEKGNHLVLKTKSNRTAEGIARGVVVEMGATATMAFYPLTGTQVRSSLVLRTFSLAYRVGLGLLQARTDHQDPVAAVATQIGGRVIFTGKVVDVMRRNVGGFHRGQASFDGTGAWSGQSLAMDFQNEFLMAKIDGATAITTPDLICIVDAQSGEPLTAEQVRYGQRLSVIGSPCYPRWRSEEGLRTVGPAYFGYNEPYSAFIA